MLVLALTVALAFVGAAILGVCSRSHMEVVRRGQSVQTFWTAEAGLQQARTMLKNNASYRASPWAFGETNGPLQMRVSVLKNGNVYTLTSLGTNTAAGLQRSLSQKMRLVYGTITTNFAIFSDPGNVELSQAAAVFGSVFAHGNVSLGQSAIIYGSAYGANYASDPTVQDPYSLQPQPEFPPLDTGYYDDAIAYAATHDSGLNLAADINLAGQTRYVAGDWNQNRAIRITSTPPGGTLVVSGDVKLNKDGLRVGPNVNLIVGGGLTMMKAATVATNCFIYADDHIVIKQAGSVLQQSAFVTPGDIDCQQAIAFNGLMYARGQVSLKQSVAIYGLIFAYNGVDMQQATAVFYMPQMLPPGWPVGVQTNATATLQAYEWSEQ